MNIDPILSWFHYFLNKIESFCFFLVLMPINTQKFIRWLPAYLTDDYDPSLIILDCFVLLCIFFVFSYLYLATKYLSITRDFIKNFFKDFAQYTIATYFFIENHFWIILTFSIIITVFIHQINEKLRKKWAERYEFMEESDEIIYSETESEIFEDISGYNGWGEKGFSDDNTNFVAPSKCVKIRGLIGDLSRGSMTDNIRRIHQEIRNRLTPNLVNGPLTWKSLVVDTQSSVVYIWFKEIEKASEAFQKMNGFFFDRQLIFEIDF